MGNETTNVDVVVVPIRLHIRIIVGVQEVKISHYPINSYRALVHSHLDSFAVIDYSIYEHLIERVVRDPVVRWMGIADNDVLFTIREVQKHRRIPFQD